LHHAITTAPKKIQLPKPKRICTVKVNTTSTFTPALCTPKLPAKKATNAPSAEWLWSIMDEAPAKGNFQMQFTSSPQSIEAGKAATLSFTPKNKDNANAAVPLEVEHEKKIHLIVVSEDLSWFSHIHPEYQTDGSFTVD
jgi:hypothetical protein